jgi:hypothetical protein
MADEKKAAVSLKRGMPAEQNNGMYGAEETLMALGVKGRFTGIVEVEISDIVHSEADGTRRPVVEFVHIEPLWEKDARETASGLRQAANTKRTGADQLNFDGIEDEPEETPDTPETPDNVTDLGKGKKGQF